MVEWPPMSRSAPWAFDTAAELVGATAPVPVPPERHVRTARVSGLEVENLRCGAENLVRWYRTRDEQCTRSSRATTWFSI